MDKREFSKTVAKKANIDRKAAKRVIGAVFETIEDCLKVGDKITFNGFGTFSTKERKARTGRNPQTGEAVEIPAKVVPAFKPSKMLKDNLL